MSGQALRVAARRRTILATLAIPANRQAEVHGSGTRSEGDEFDRPNGGLAGRADPAILAPMPKLRPAIRYGIDALLILIPLLGMTYFLFDPEAFNAFLAWLARIL
jgi:hypothetical protein